MIVKHKIYKRSTNHYLWVVVVAAVVCVCVCMSVCVHVCVCVCVCVYVWLVRVCGYWHREDSAGVCGTGHQNPEPKP